jgi:hypothetical protein
MHLDQRFKRSAAASPHDRIRSADRETPAIALATREPSAGARPGGVRCHERTRDGSAGSTNALATGPPRSPREASCRSVSAGWKHSGSQTGCACSLPVVKRSYWASHRPVVGAFDSPRLVSRSATPTRTARLHSPSRSRSRPGRSCCSSRLASLQRRRRSRYSRGWCR